MKKINKGDLFWIIFYFKYFTLFYTASSAVLSNSTMSDDAGIEPRTVATLALSKTLDIIQSRLYLIHKGILRMIFGKIDLVFASLCRCLN
jgi:hypothetical protein